MKKPIILISIILLAANLLSAQIINVPTDYPTIQQGIDAANNGDTVLVAPGTYCENINISKRIVIASHYLTTLDTSYISETVIDGGQNGSVVKFNGGSSNSYMQGFSLINGNGSNGNGGGVLVDAGVLSHLYFSNLIIKNNSASYGGGIQNTFGYLYLINVKILNNYATYDGGGIHSGEPYGSDIYSSITGNNVSIKDNEAGGKGGGFCNHKSHFKFYNSEFSNNSSKHGGGLYFSYEGTSFLKNVKVINNIASNNGGGICVGPYTFFELRNVEVGYNQAMNGGGLFVSAALIHHEHTNLLIHNNTAEDRGGGMFLSYAFYGSNITIVDNDADFGNGIYCNNLYMSLKNIIVFGETSQQIVCAPDGFSSTITVSNSLIMGGQYFIETNGNATVNWLEGNINQNPQFVNSGDYPYQINDNSPCIDAGSPDTTGITEFDLAGEPRFFNSHIDMGAYEWNTFVGMEEENIQEANNGFLIYPNPAQNQITISTNNQATISQLNIYNQLGQKVLHLESPASTIDISEIGKGLFVVEIVSEGDRFRSKLIKN